MKLDRNCPSDVTSRVSYNPETGIFTALKNAGKRKYLGMFETEDEAKGAYRDAAKKYFGKYSHAHRPKEGE